MSVCVYLCFVCEVFPSLFGFYLFILFFFFGFFGRSDKTNRSRRQLIADSFVGWLFFVFCCFAFRCIIVKKCQGQILVGLVLSKT